MYVFFHISKDKVFFYVTKHRFNKYLAYKFEDLR